jgi:RNA polymerase sigma factor (sigma-70 family)
MLTLSERNTLILQHLPFAERIAAVQFKKTPSCVQLDELRSAAYMGLVDAASKYDGTKPFEVYASFRIFGEIKDYLRTLYWNGRGKSAKVNSWDDSYDYAAEPEPDNFDEFFEGVTKDLSPLGKKILWLYYVEDLTLKEIATRVGLSPTRVYQLLQVNLKSLRNSLDSMVN